MTAIALNSSDSVAKQEEKKIQNERFEELRSQLTGFIESRIPEPEDAQDILHDVYLQMSAMVEPIDQLRGWLFRVAKNKIVDRFRKKKPSAFSEIGQEAFDQIGSRYESMPDDEMMNQLILETIGSALSELPPNQREVFEMHELQGLSFQAIAELLHVPVNTLISRKRYAVLHLRKRLKNIYQEFKN